MDDTRDRDDAVERGRSMIDSLAYGTSISSSFIRLLFGTTTSLVAAVG